jgi:hypothetical protein
MHKHTSAGRPRWLYGHGYPPQHGLGDQVNATVG